MADAFRGLTLRIGADARPLQSAISNITRSAAQAQKQMNRLNKALEFDSTNVKMMENRLDLVGDKAQHSARAVAKIKTAMQQAVAEAKGFDLKKLASETKDAHAVTQHLRDEYNQVDASLQHIYDALGRVASRTKNLSKSDDTLANVASRLKNISKSDALDYVKKLRKEMEGTGEAADKAREDFRSLVKNAQLQDAVDHIKKLKEQMKGSGDVAAKAREEFMMLFETASRETGINKLFGQNQGDVQALLATLDKLIDRHKKLNTEYQKMEAVQGYRAMEMEASAYEAEVRQAASETARLRTELFALGTGGKLTKSVNSIKMLDSASEKAVASAHQMIDAYRQLPSSLDRMRNKMTAVATAEATLKVRTEAIKEALKAIESDPAFDKLAASSEEAYVNAVKVENEYADLKGSLDLVEEEAKDLKQQLRALDDSGADKASDDYKELKNSLEKAEAKAKELRTALNNLDDAHATSALIVEQKRLQDELARTEIQARNLHTQMSKLTAMGTTGKGMRQFGFGMYASLTPATLMAGRYMLQAAEDTDAAYRDMRKTVNGTDEEFERLLDHAIEFSTTHITTAEQMLEIEAIGGQLGITVDNLEAFAHTVSNLDIATNMNAEDIATDLGKMGTVLGLSESQYDRFGDALVRLGNNMPVMEGDIMNLTNRFMGMAKVVGMSPDQMLGWAAAASATGQKAEAAGSSMQRFISKMETAVNSSDEDLQRWADVAHMSVDEFRRSFDEDASGTMYRFIEGLGDIQKSGGSVNQVLDELGIRNVRDKQLLEGFANQMANATEDTNTLKDALQMSSDAFNGMDTIFKDGRGVERAGDAMREAEKKSEGFSGAISKMRNQGSAMMIELAKGAAPLVDNLSNVFGKVTNFLRNSSDGMKTFAVGTGVALAAVGPLTVGLGTFLQSIDTIGSKAVPTAQKKLTQLGTAILESGSKMGRGSTAVMKLGMAIGSLATGPGLAAFAGIAVGIGLIVKAVDDYVQRMRDYEAVTEGSVDVARRFANMGNATVESLTESGDAAKNTALSVDQLVEKYGEVTRAQQASADAAENDIARLSTAQQIIERYANTDLSGNLKAQAELRAAVDTVNDICGTQISVIDAVNGKLEDETGQIETTTAALSEYIEQKRNAILVDEISEALESEWEKADETAARLSEVNSEIDKLHEKEERGGHLFKEEREKLADLNDERDRLLDILHSSQEASAIYEEQLANIGIASDKTNASVRDLANGSSTLTRVFGNDMDALGKFSEDLEAAGMTTEEFYSLLGPEGAEKWAEAKRVWENSGGDMEQVMDSLGLKVRTTVEQYEQELADATGSTESWQAALDKTGLTGEELVDVLQGAGISANKFAQIGGEAFAELYNAADGDITKTVAMIDALDAAGIDPKEVEITTDEDGITRIGDQIFSLNENVMRIGDRKFKITAEGNWEELTESIDEAEYEFDEFTESIELYEDEVEEAEQTMSDLVAQNANLASQLNKSGLSADQFSSFLEQMGVSMDDLINATPDMQYAMVDAFDTVASAADSCGVNTEDMMAKVAASGISFDTLAKVGGDAFARIYDDCNGNMDLVKQKIDEYNSLPFKDKQNYLKSDSSDAVNKIKDVNNNRPLYNKNMSLLARDYASGAINGVNRMWLNDHTTHLYAVDHASGVIGSIAGRIASLPSSHTISFWASGGIFGHAAGGVAIPKHAPGGFGVATQATLTSAGWVGEDGWEAIVPLTNRRYVRPFAQAVASEVRLPSSGGDTFNITVNAMDSAEDVARRIRLELTAWEMTRKAG